MTRLIRSLAFALALVVAVPLVAAAQSNGTSTLDEIRERGTLIAGVRYDMPPFGYVEEGDQPTGIDIDLVTHIAEKLGVEIELRQVTAQTRIPMLLNGNVDLLAAGIAHTRERDEVVDFTVTYLQSGNLFLVTPDSEVESYRDLDGKVVATIQGTPYMQGLQRLLPTVKPLTFQEYPQAVLAVEQGHAAALMADDTTLLGLTKGREDRFKLVGDIADFPRWFIALAVRENDSDWRDFLNFTLSDLWQQGELQEMIKREGLSVPPNFEIEPWQF